MLGERDNCFRSIIYIGDPEARCSASTFERTRKRSVVVRITRVDEVGCRTQRTSGSCPRLKRQMSRVPSSG